MGFWEALRIHEFLQYALLAGALASVASGVVGTYVVTRRISYLAAAIAHFVLAGMGCARYLQVTRGWAWATPLTGALVAAVVAAVLVAWVTLKARQREDTVIGALWAVGMAVGILFISRTPGFNENLMSYLFGNILMVTPTQVWLLVVLDMLVLAVALLLHRRFVAICFDEEFARVRGLPVDLYFTILLVLTALTVVILITVVGVVMVIALLTLPAAVAGLITRRLGTMMVLAVGLAAMFTATGIVASYGPSLPSGATIVVVASLAYLGGLALSRLIRSRRVASASRR